MNQVNWPITKKKTETMEAPQNRRFYGKIKCPTYTSEKGRTLAKQMGLSEVLLGTPLGNT
jgi:hypothetical protein